MFRWPFFIFLFILKTATLSGQTLNYIISLKDEDVGVMTVKRNLSGNKASYLIESNISVDKIINITTHYRMEAEFEKGQLIHSSVKQISNGKIQVSSDTRWDGTKYVIKTLEGTRKIKEKFIGYNLAMLYFVEPVNNTEIWSDSYCHFLSINLTRKHSYKLVTPEGKISFYTFNYGICSMVETEQLFSKIKFRLSK